MSTILLGESGDGELHTEAAMPDVAAGEVLLGTLAAIDESGNPLVGFPHYPQFLPVAALATIPVLPQHIGRQVALLFTHGIDQRPIVIGFIYSPLQQLLDNFTEQSALTVEQAAAQDQQVFDVPSAATPRAVDVDTVQVDGRKVVIEAQEEVVLKCGEASITLTREGKVVIRGKYLLSRSSGVNRILGGSVQVN